MKNTSITTCIDRWFLTPRQRVLFRQGLARGAGRVDLTVTRAGQVIVRVKPFVERRSRRSPS